MSPFMFRTASSPASAPARGSAQPRMWAGWMLFGCAFVVQAAFPYTDGGTSLLTAASVLFLTGAVLAHVVVSRGVRSAIALAVVAGGGGLLAETVGVHTGIPFGQYTYTGTLGLEVAGVPALVPLAWIMMAWPALAVARRLVGRNGRLLTAVVGAWALTAWDVFLDPQMVDQGHWIWASPHPALPGVAGIPVTNFLGWLLVSFLMMVALDRLISAPAPTDIGADTLPITIYLWTYVSSVIAHALFFGRPPVAIVGGVLMGVVAVPLAIKLFRGDTRATN